ncbi:MAG: RdgB/HAM1 family non-canonical purine NTP pyrophosphatase [Lachnospiraceae bacterium]|nr:RdgB/HAM1 family non-canonical purine NTP pyrophosphatase [Lachnospiraceae bacterium]
MKIVFATGNENKVVEIRAIFKDLNAEITTMAQEGISIDIEENGTSFRENAMIKAESIAPLVKDAIVMADDSGLVIDALNGEPGIYSARYLGHDTSYHEKNGDLLRRLEGVPDEKRTARFVCAVAAVLPDGRKLVAEETMEGRIGYEEKGSNGFGYDPIFFLPEEGRYSAELAPEEKNAISHRGKALRKMRELIHESIDRQ